MEEIYEKDIWNKNNEKKFKVRNISYMKVASIETNKYTWNNAWNKETQSINHRFDCVVILIAYQSQAKFIAMFLYRLINGEKNIVKLLVDLE